MPNRTRPRARAAAAALLLLSACSPAPPLSPEPSPPVAVVTAPAAPASDSPLRWPTEEGWYRLEVRVEVPAGATVGQRADAVSTVRWSRDRLEITVEAHDPADPSGSSRRHRTVADPSAADLAALRDRFEQSQAAGLLEDGTGEWGGRRFEATHVGPDGVAVTEIWEVGAGPAPWSPAP